MDFRFTDSVITGVQPKHQKKYKVKGKNLLDTLFGQGELEQDGEQIQTFDEFRQAINKFDFIKNTQLQLNAAKNVEPHMVKPKYVHPQQTEQRRTNFYSHNIQSLDRQLDDFRGSLQPSRGYLNVVNEQTRSRSSFKRTSSFHQQTVQEQKNYNNYNVNLNTPLNAGMKLTYKINQQSFYPHQQPSIKKQQQINDNNSMYKSSAHSSRSCAGNQRINQYQIKQKIGVGAFSQVHLCVDVVTGQKFAMKIMNRKHFQKKLFRKNSIALADNYISNQVAILKKMSHPYIIKLYQAIQDPKKMFLILQYCAGGFINEIKSTVEADLALRVSGGNLKYRKLMQSQCKRHFKQISLAIDYIHNVAKIAHRDIKPQNILLSEKGQVKISDFGLGTQDIEVSSKSGTKGYIPPQARATDLLSSKTIKVTTQMADIWALGVTLLVMLQGKQIQMQGDQSRIQTHVNSLKDVSSQCKDFILKCLKVDPNQRITAAQIIDHPWIMAKKIANYQQLTVSKQDQQTAIIQRNKDILAYLTKTYIK